MSKLQEGDAAPPFSLQDQDGRTVRLGDFKGKQVVLYFYPKDDTPGCTLEACSFRDRYASMKDKGVVVLGVSRDDQQSHQRFARKHELPFPLLVDPDHRVAEAYGAWGEKTLYGRKSVGMIRSTFLIGPDGKVKKAWPKVKVQGHTDRVLEAIG